MYCFDTDVLSAVLRASAPLELVRRLALVPPAEQHTTAITLGELLFGVARRDNEKLRQRIRDLVVGALTVLPFDDAAAEIYGPLRAQLERQGRRLGEPDLRVAAISLSRDLTLVTGNGRHFARVPGLRLEDWLAG